jgi:hypothetical protein
LFFFEIWNKFDCIVDTNYINIDTRALFTCFFNFLPHEHIAIEKPPVTSSNCYETIKNASLLMKLGTNVDYTIASVTACSMVNFLLPWPRGDVSKWPKITILHCFFPSKLISKCCNFSMNWDRVKCFSASVISYPKIDLRPF